jgi:hypothetical protein
VPVAPRDDTLRKNGEKMARKASPVVPAIDFEVQNHGTIFLLCPLTDSAIIVRGIQDAGLLVCA